MPINNGDIYLAELNPTEAYEIGGIRPVIIVSNSSQNELTPTILVAPITSNIYKKVLPTHIRINVGQGGSDKTV